MAQPDIALSFMIIFILILLRRYKYLIIECLAIVIFNAVSACVLVKMRQQQRRGTCLIIHLAIVDLSVGAVAGHVFIQGLGASCNLWENVLWSEKYSWVNYLILTLRQLFLYLSVKIWRLFHQREHMQPFSHSSTVALKNGSMEL